METPFTPMQNDDGSYFVNFYTVDREGITRRETIADELTEQAAQSLVDMLNSMKTKLRGPLAA